MNYVEVGYVRSGYIELDSDTQGPCTFSGHGRLIKIEESTTAIDITEIYSRWKDWVQADANGDSSSKWSIAMRYSGKDPIPGGFTGSTFFMINGWKLVFNPNTTAVNGVLFSEDYATAYWNYDLLPIFPVTVSAVVNQVTTTQNIVTGDISSLPNLTQIVTGIVNQLYSETIPVNVKEINDITVTGSGVEGDTWGPA
jgi:hypothetical protein